MNIIKDGSAQFGARVFTAVSGFLATLYFAHELGPALLGAYFLAIGVGMLASVPSQALATAMAKRYSERETAAYIGAGATLVGAMTAFAATLSTFLVPNLPFPATVSSWGVAGIVAATGVYTLARSVLIGREAVGREAGVVTIERAARALVQVVLVMLGFGINGLLLGYIVMRAIVGVAALGRHHALLGRPNREHIYSILRFGGYQCVQTIRTRAFNWTDTVILGLFVAPALIGIYEVAWALVSALALVSSSIQTAVYPRISDRLDEMDSAARKRVATLLQQSVGYSGVCAIPGVVGVAILAPPLLRLYGADFVATGATTVLVLLAGARLWMTYEDQFVSALSAINRPASSFRINLVFITSNVVLNLLLVTLIGWTGAALATFLSSAVALALSTIEIRSVLPELSLPTTDISHQTLAAVAMAGPLLIAESLGATHTATGTVAVVGLGAATYSAVLATLSARVRQTFRSLNPVLNGGLY